MWRLENLCVFRKNVRTNNDVEGWNRALNTKASGSKLSFYVLVQEEKLLQQELKSLPKGAKVYKQQQNSNIFFMTTKEKTFEQSKRTLDSLIQEYDDKQSMKGSEKTG